ncbi:TIGR03862 family flavoprotein [Bombella sp. TMW 2.2559]|uniref:TIGR03862 family flavoprotein n=1 Tax=Bombella dulcis TaxID=2967339 RepID=A0ABT3WB75_9PROT|nr:TIGR03862 family flavoprotein [Bombella dulcis]MCX5616344.1 TIGR03862 family flavoprotein [Bombella dulcis]
MPENSTAQTSPIAIIGAGPAGLFAAECLSRKGHEVHLFDYMARPGRKFLMAGRSGLNLTHDEPLEQFLQRYGDARDWLEPAIRHFPPEALRQWAEGLGEPCFTGSSGRVFLKSFKASPLLRRWLTRLQEQGVQFFPRHRLTDMQGLSLTFQTPEGPVHRTARAVILAPGGGSWARLGSDGRWTSLLKEHCTPFAPSNCGFMPDWPEDFLLRHEGATLRGITLSFAGQTHRGDLIITKRGLEGAPLYALSAPLRQALAQSDGKAVTVHLNLRPTLERDRIMDRLARQRIRESRSNRLRKALGMDRTMRELLVQLCPDARTADELTQAMTQAPLHLAAPAELDRAISTAGGLKRDSVDETFMLRHQPGLFACGEMLDWDAPTGGYLLQGCFSTAHCCAEGVHHWLSRSLPGKMTP